MATQTINHPDRSIPSSDSMPSWIKKYMLMRFHPRSLLLDSIGFMWFVYYFWHHDWTTALSAMLIARIVAITSVKNMDTRRFSVTTIGKIALLHLHPLNITIQLLGLIALLYALWLHSTEMILASLSIILLGHMFGWSKVDDSLAEKTA